MENYFIFKIDALIVLLKAVLQSYFNRLRAIMIELFKLNLDFALQ